MAKVTSIKISSVWGDGRSKSVRAKAETPTGAIIIAFFQTRKDDHVPTGVTERSRSDRRNFIGTFPDTICKDLEKDQEIYLITVSSPMGITE